MKKVCSVLLLSLCSLATMAQIDKVFWFAAPEVIFDHGDEPILLRFTTFDKPAVITISFPANPVLQSRTVSLNANSTSTVDLTNIKASLENDVPNVVSNKGILIESTSEITAYYEINASNNPDIFTLKGRSGLGLEFFTPFQNVYNNQSSNFLSYSSFDIVATEDSTEVTITPSIEVFGHAAAPFTISLNKGQTYSVRAKDGLATSHPVGSRIVSNKPIAVTIKDDSVVRNTSWDLIGDQLIPVKSLGDKYGITFGSAVILAARDSTTIVIDGIVEATLNAGESIYHNFFETPGFINSQNGKAFYVLQIGGIGDELGGAILPPLGCTGSKKIAFTRSTFEEFKLMVLIKSGHEGNFRLNGNPTYVTPSDFSSINEDWKVAEIDLTTIFGQATVFLLENATSDFHLGIRNGDGITGARFGYFSDFGILDLGTDQTFCEGDEGNVLDAGISKDSYLWNTGETTQTITVDTGGTYIVTATKGECTFSDTVNINVVQNVVINDFGADTSICVGDSLVLLPGGNEFSYLWQDQSTDTLFVVKSEGAYSVSVFNEEGCFKTESIVVGLRYKPEFSLGNDTIICSEDNYMLALEPDLGSYLWSTESTDNSIVVTSPGFYSVNVTNACGSTSDGMIVDFWNIEIPNIVTPNQDGKNDFFTVSGLNDGEWSLVVRNRWGDEVYSNPSYQNTFSPERLSDGLYYYRLKEQSECNEFIGWLLIKR